MSFVPAAPEALVAVAPNLRGIGSAGTPGRLTRRHREVRRSARLLAVAGVRRAPFRSSAGPGSTAVTTRNGPAIATRVYLLARRRRGADAGRAEEMSVAADIRDSTGTLVDLCDLRHAGCDAPHALRPGNFRIVIQNILYLFSM